ncbi:MAG: hypothetical protein U1E28_22725 [Beijerinckiaceae bacterium]
MLEQIGFVADFGDAGDQFVRQPMFGNSDCYGSEVAAAAHQNDGRNGAAQHGVGFPDAERYILGDDRHGIARTPPLDAIPKVARQSFQSRPCRCDGRRERTEVADRPDQRFDPIADGGDACTLQQNAGEIRAILFRRRARVRLHHIEALADQSLDCEPGRTPIAAKRRIVVVAHNDAPILREIEIGERAEGRPNLASAGDGPDHERGLHRSHDAQWLPVAAVEAHDRAIRNADEARNRFRVAAAGLRLVDRTTVLAEFDQLDGDDFVLRIHQCRDERTGGRVEANRSRPATCRPRDAATFDEVGFCERAPNGLRSSPDRRRIVVAGCAI